MKRHDTDPVSLVPALVFLGLAGWWALDRLTPVDLPLAWLTAVTLLVAGAVGLIVTLTRHQELGGGTDSAPRDSTPADTATPVSIRTDAAGDGGPELAAGTPAGDATTGDLPR